MNKEATLRNKMAKGLGKLVSLLQNEGEGRRNHCVLWEQHLGLSTHRGCSESKVLPALGMSKDFTSSDFVSLIFLFSILLILAKFKIKSIKIKKLFKFSFFFLP